MLGRQPIAARDFRRAGLAAAERAALLEQVRPCGAMDRAVNAAAAEQRRIRGVHDGVEGKRRDVRDDDLAGRGAGREGEEGVCHACNLPLALRSGERESYAHSAFASAPRSIVERTPISSKCSFRNVSAALRPPSRSIWKKSKSEL